VIAGAGFCGKDLACPPKKGDKLKWNLN